MQAHQLWRELCDLLAPVQCPGCGEGKTQLCSGCQKLLYETPQLVERGLSLRGRHVPVISGGIYHGVRRSVMLEFKNGSRQKLAIPLVEGLRKSLWGPREGRGDYLNIVPVPSSLRGMWNRGYLPALLLATALANTTPAVVWKKLVVPRWRVGIFFRARKASSTRKSRLQRSSRDFRITRRGRGEKVVLLDDVLVTGATIRAAATALMDAGYIVVAVLVVAHVPDRG